MTQPTTTWGATPAEWDAFIALASADVRPCVTNPKLFTKLTKAIKERRRTGWSFAKRPSKVYSCGDVAGITAWAQIDADHHDFEQWRIQPDHGIGIVGRKIKGIDIDIDNEAVADEIDDLICDFFDADLPQRRRANSGRRLLLFRIQDQDVPMDKVIVATPHGNIEFLGDKQFMACAGMHESGHRIEWPDGIPTTLDEIPAITHERLTELVRQIANEYGTTPDVMATTTIPEARSADQVDLDDPLTQYVLGSDGYIDQMPDGAFAVVCPWHEQHESTGGQRIDDNLTATLFFPAGLGGLSDAGFQCMHMSHGPKTIGDFKAAIGYTAANEFDVLDTDASDSLGRPHFIGESAKGIVPSNEYNLALALQWLDKTGLSIRYDDFRLRTSIREQANGPWVPFDDSHFVTVGMALNQIGMITVNDTKLRKAIHAYARSNRFDEAIEWLTSLKWDGDDRLAQFAQRVMATEPSDYADAVVRYLFTAMAGRVLEPGIQADMMPILYGRQGARKSTFVRALTPQREWYGTHDFHTSPADAARLLRGKVIVELDELRGLASRDEDRIKAWVTTTHDSWVPKFMEFETTAPRRFVGIGTTNTRRMLADPTGSRRWLPLHVGVDGQFLDVEFVQRHRDQLWAQGAALFKTHGVLWHAAETAGRSHSHSFQRFSSAMSVTDAYLREHQITSGITVAQVLRMAFGMEMTDSRADTQVGHISRALVALGYEESAEGEWHLSFL